MLDHDDSSGRSRPDGDDVEAHLNVFPHVPGKEVHGDGLDLASLEKRHGGLWRPEAFSAPGLHLHEGDESASPCHDVDFPTARAVIPRQDAPSPVLEDAGRQDLASSTETVGWVVGFARHLPSCREPKGDPMPRYADCGSADQPTGPAMPASAGVTSRSMARAMTRI